jgi:integrase
MSVYKKEGSKFFWYGFTFKGRRVQRSSKATNQREAENIEKAAWTQLARGEVAIADKPEAERKTIGQLLDALTEDFKDRKKDTPKNLNLVATVKSELGDRYADTFKTKDVKSYVSELRKPQKPKTKKKGRRSKSLSNSTIKHRLQVLVSAYEVENVAREDEDFPPLRVPRYPKKKKKEDLKEADPREGFLDRAQFDVLLRHLPEDLRDYCLFAYLTGWRKSAVAGLEWSDVRNGNVYLRGVLSKNKTPYYVPILGELAKLIERRKEAREVKVNDTVVLTNLVFHRAGERVQEFRKSWASACKAAGLPASQLFHDLRRSSCRNLIRSGCDRDTAKRIGGWKSDSILTRYNIITEDDVQQGMEKVIAYNEAESQKVVVMAASR